MPKPSPLVALALLVILAACGADRNGGPKGDATAIVTGAPNRTLAAGRARVHVATASATADGEAVFATATAKTQVRPATAEDVLLRQPLLAVDVVRATVSVRPYGGAEVRGASTIKYELDVAPPRDLVSKLGGSLRGNTFYADVFIDSARRIRRVTVPLDLNEPRPDDNHKFLAKVATVDFYDFAP